jgi:GT2 family glycosyltransferase
MTECPLVVISILNWNGWQDTVACLESVRRLDYPNYLTAVVDNGSSDESAEKIKAWAHENLGAGHVLADYTREIALQGGDPHAEEALQSVPSPARLVLIRNEENLGFTGGHNMGISYSLQRCEPASYILLVNNDASLTPDCLSRLVEVARKAKAGIVGAVVRDSNGRVQFAGSGPLWREMLLGLTRASHSLRNEDYWASPVVYGCAMLIGRDVLEAIHRKRGSYLSEALFAYADELDLCYRADREGFKPVIARNAVACHHSSTRHKPYDDRIFHYYATRNRVLVAREVLPLARRVAFHILYIPLAVRRVLKQLLAGRPESARAAWCGLLDGYRGASGKWKCHDRQIALPNRRRI